MSENIFSTGNLTATWGGVTQVVSPANLTTQRYYPANGAAPISPGASGTYPPENATDGNIATVADFSINGTGENQYLVVDMGQTRNITQVALNNYNDASTGDIGSVTVYIGSVASDPPGSESMTQIGSTQSGVQSGNLTFSAGEGLALSGRYVFVSALAPAGYTLDQTVGEIVPTQALNYIAPGGIVFGAMQDVEFSAAFQRKDLYDAAQNSIFAVDSADHEGKFDITAKSTTIDAAHMQLLVAAQISQATVNSNSATLATLLNDAPLPYFAVSVSLVSSAGKTILITAGNCKAQGVSLPAKLEDYVVADFKVSCYPDGNGVVATLGYED